MPDDEESQGWDGLSWTLLERRPLHDYRVFRTEERVMTHPGRREGRGFFVIDSPDWVNVVAITPDDEVVLIRQYRHGVDGLTLEIPGGVIDPGEDAATAAARELQEETGYTAPTWRYLGVVEPNPAIQTNRASTWLALDATVAGPQALDENELIEVSRAPLSDVPGLIVRGAIQHALVVAAFAHLAAWSGGFRRPPSPDDLPEAMPGSGAG